MLDFFPERNRRRWEVPELICLILQVRARAEPRNLAVGDPEVVEVGPAMFSIPQVTF